MVYYTQMKRSAPSKEDKMSNPENLNDEWLALIRPEVFAGIEQLRRQVEANAQANGRESAAEYRAWRTEADRQERLVEASRKEQF